MVLGKRLRKKIKEACELEGLSKEDTLSRAFEIIDDYDFKQGLCIKYPGLTHKDIDRTMKAILANKQLKTKEEDINPEKYSCNIYGDISKSSIKYGILTREETRKLVEASDEPVIVEERAPQLPGRGYAAEEVQSLIRGDYHPSKFKYLHKKKH